jgi:ribonucleotide reductase alpha subunit
VSPEFIEPNEPRKLYEALLTHQIVPGGRHLWATGVQTGNSAINNCHGADFTTRFSEHFEHMFMRLMEGGGVGSNVSDKFIQSKAKGKWTITTPHELHIVCADYHQDVDTTLELDNHEDAKLLGFMTEEGTLQNGAVFPSKYSDYFVKVPFRSLLSKEMNYSSAPISGEDRVYISVGDSREGWAEALVKILDLYVSEGPKKKIVVDITGIRPHGAPIRTFGGTASGPGALMLLLARITSLFNSQMGVVTWKQVALIEHWIALAVISGGTRRSARMLMKYWQDPGIFEFIKLKEHLPTGHVPHHTTNISVVVDKKFFRAIRRMDAHAMAVLDAIVFNMLMNGEPGLVNASNQLIDEIKGAVFYVLNPCLPDYTWVDTTEGPKQIRDLVGVPFTAVVNGEEVDSTEQGFFLTGQKPLVRLYTNHGTLDLTEDHRVLMANGDFVEAGLLEPGDEVQLNVWDGPSDKLPNHDFYEALGWLYGDGCLPTKSNVANFDFWGDDIDYGVSLLQRAIPEKATITRNNELNRVRVRVADARNLVKGVLVGTGKDKQLDPQIEKLPVDVLASFIRGWFGADGSVQGTSEKGISLRLTSIHEESLTVAQRILLRLGIRSRLYRNRTSARHKDMPDGRGSMKSYSCNAVHELVISRNSLHNFNQVVGLPEKKQAQLTSLLNTLSRPPYKDPNTTVIDVVSLDSVVNVYDCTIPEGHVFSANGILVHNCGEITMVKYDDMYCFDVCCIGHLNLATLEDPDGKAKLLARFLMRASMAKIVDPRMKMNVDRNHRLGAGILGYADWLLLNGVRYSEAPKNGEVKKFFSHLRDRITEEANNYAHTLRVVAPIKTTTIAPTGTIANLSGVTSGMQPVFAQYYIRRVRYADTGDQQTLDNLRSQGYNVYQDPYSPATSVVDFVTEHVLHGRAMELFKQKHPELPESEIRDMVDDLFEDEGTLTFTDVFANQEMLQECWANNAISVTANVRRETDTEELRQQISEVTKAILFYGERLKGLTMFPEVSMAAAPLERLTKEEFNKYREEGYPIDVSQDEQKCVNGVCPIK